MTPFVLDAGNAVAWLRDHALLDAGVPAEATELSGGVSASVVAVRPAGAPAVVVKQALARFRTADEWRAKQERTDVEAAAMRFLGALSPGVVPRVLHHDPAAHVLVMELVTGASWQAEIGAGRAHAELGDWAGETLGTWHRETAGRDDVTAAFADFESFEQQRLDPFHETVMRRRPELADAIAPYVGDLRESRTCLVHGDYAPKNMLVGPSGRHVVDFEVAHWGNPLFDLAFFLSFVVLSALRWPEHAGELRALGEGFVAAYERAVETELDRAAVTGHAACLVLARTDGKSPALFLDEPTRARARAAGLALLSRPQAGLWHVLPG